MIRPIPRSRRRPIRSRQGQAAGGPFVSGAVARSQAERAVGPQGFGVGTDGDAGSNPDVARAGGLFGVRRGSGRHRAVVIFPQHPHRCRAVAAGVAQQRGELGDSQLCGGAGWRRRLAGTYLLR